MYYHSRTNRKRYMSYPQPAECHFCHPDTYAKKIIERSPHAYVIENRVPYDFWEMRRVARHYMVIPKRHVLSLAELTSEEQADVMAVIARYESQGYDIFARSPVSGSRSVPHQHTHLVKLEGPRGRGQLYLERPHILVHFRRRR